MKPAGKKSRPRRPEPKADPSGLLPWQVARLRQQERMQRDLLMKIRRWAKAWTRCPYAGCRRNNRCLREDDCRAESKDLTDEHLRLIRERVLPFLRKDRAQ